MTWANEKQTNIRRDARYYITEHAAHRLRDRGEHNLQSMTDRDLAILLDERIQASVEANRVTKVIDADAPDVDTTVVDIDCRDGRKLHVVMRYHRPNSYPQAKMVLSTSGHALAAITVLTTDMASQAYANKRWVMKNTLSTRPFASALANVKPAEKPPEKPATSPEPKKTVSWSLGGSQEDREAFARGILRADPGISSVVLGKRVGEKFGGAAMSNEKIKRLRAEVAAEAPVVSIVPPPAPPPEPAKVAPVPAASVTVVDANIAAQYMQACEMERTARARYEAAERELAAARKVFEASRAQCDELMQQLAARRSA